MAGCASDLAGWSTGLAGWSSGLAGWALGLAGWLGLRPGWLGLRPSWMFQRGEQMDKQTNEWMENLPILQDFVPYRGRCPKKQYKINIRIISFFIYSFFQSFIHYLVPILLFFIEIHSSKFIYSC